jgi:hypothetical protein
MLNFKSKIMKTVFLGRISSSNYVFDSSLWSKERSSAVVVDREAIKTEIQAMEDAFAESYNNKNTDSIKYIQRMPLVFKW